MDAIITEDSFLAFKCPSCGNPVSFPQDTAGHVQECPNCTESVIVPDDGSEAGRPLPFPLATPRLVLRRFQPGDWKDLLEIVSDEEMFRYGEGRPLGEEEVLGWLETDRHVKLTTANQPFYLGIQLPDGGKLVGYATLSFAEPQRLQAELRVTVGRGHQRTGLATEAVAVLLSFCFDGIALHRVTARCDPRNLAAGRVCDKVGLRREGVFQQDHLLNGEWADTAWYAMLNEEYRAADNAAAPPGAA